MSKQSWEYVRPGPLPVYRCHKLVRAFQIKHVVWIGNGVLQLTDKQGHHIELTKKWYDKHQPKVGGYFVVYEDGYASFSPQRAFEQGYTLVEDDS